MRIGVVTETKLGERRVALTDAGARALRTDGHDVLVESGAGLGAGITDDDYQCAGAKIVSVADAWAAELVVKVKEPVAAEYDRLREETILFTYLHLAADRPLTEALLDRRVTAIAYETVVDDRGELPLLKPMSEVAGRLAAHAAGHYLMHPAGGPGLLLGGSPGVPPARVTVLGGGVVGTQAALLAVGMRADVTILDTSPRRVRELEEQFGRQLHVLHSQGGPAISAVQESDVIIGAVLVPGAAAPQLLTRDDLRLLRPCSSTSPSTRAAASQRPDPPPTKRRPTRWTASPTTAWRTCRAAYRAPRPAR